MTREEELDWLYRLRSEIYVYMPREWLIPMNNALDMVIKELEQKTTTKNDLGVDCISRQAVLEQAYAYGNGLEPDGYCVNVEDIQALPSVTPQEPRCKECKWWKDSDGKYRRGCGAESQCPINRREVFEGNGYCYLFEPQESENP